MFGYSYIPAFYWHVRRGHYCCCRSVKGNYSDDSASTQSVTWRKIYMKKFDSQTVYHPPDFSSISTRPVREECSVATHRSPLLESSRITNLDTLPILCVLMYVSLLATEFELWYAYGTARCFFIRQTDGLPCVSHYIFPAVTWCVTFV